MADETKIAEAKTAAAQGKRKERVGEVVSNKMAKTIVVRVERRFPHLKFKKVVTAPEVQEGGHRLQEILRP
jgi:small subunit ribosomal protein S17